MKTIYLIGALLILVWLSNQINKHIPTVVYNVMDTAAIQANLNASYSAGGGTIYVPNGNYVVNKTLKIVPIPWSSDWESHLNFNQIDEIFFDQMGIYTIPLKKELKQVLLSPDKKYSIVFAGSSITYTTYIDKIEFINYP